MRLAVSNIAWPTADRDAAYALLKARGIRGLEIAPALFLPDSGDPFTPDDREVGLALDAVAAAGLRLVSMQSLLYGVKGAALFEGSEALVLFREGMRRAIGLAGRLSIPNLVFGSPRQRTIPGDMSPAQAEAIAIKVFRELGDAAGAAGTRVGVEFNPPDYGTNFLNDIRQALAFVEKVDHPAIALTFDVGAMHMNNHFNDIECLAAEAAGHISHVHISEPQLAPAPASGAQAARAMSAMNGLGYQGWFSIEMQPHPSAPLGELERSIDRLLLAAGTSGGEDRCL